VYTIVLLTEGALLERDAVRLAQLHDGDDVVVQVVVPVETDHSRVLEALDEALLGRLREAAQDSGDPDPQDARLAALHALAESKVRLQAAGLGTAEGELAADPVAATIAAVKRFHGDEVVVITPPHLVEEALHRDWASKLRARLDLPVLHTTAGTDRVIS
jgi:hypothetical protein